MSNVNEAWGCVCYVCMCFHVYTAQIHWLPFFYRLFFIHKWMDKCPLKSVCVTILVRVSPLCQWEYMQCNLTDCISSVRFSDIRAAVVMHSCDWKKTKNKTCTPYLTRVPVNKYHSSIIFIKYQNIDDKSIV